MKIKIQLASPPDRERLVAELFVGNRQFAEVSWEDDKPMLEVYPKSTTNHQEFWMLELDEVIEALNIARKSLEY